MSFSQERKIPQERGDHILPVEVAKTELEAMLGVGWSRKSIKRKIAEGRPFTWIPGRHYVQVGSKLVAINVDAVFRELVK